LVSGAVDSRQIFASALIVLAPKRKPIKFQQDMATSIEALSASMEKMATQFEGFQTMMKQTLETLSSVRAWQATADEALEHLRRELMPR